VIAWRRITVKGFIPFVFLLGVIGCSFDSDNKPLSRTIGQLEVLDVIPHQGSVWTEGLIWQDGALWESTGSRTGSGVRALDPDTGDVLWAVGNGEAFFAEGLARAFGRTYVLSFRESMVFTFDRDRIPAFEPFAQYQGEGWGLTTVGDSLVNSNGSATLFYRNPETFASHKMVEIIYQGQPVERLNELEYDGRYLWANQWLTPFIYRIDLDEPSQVLRFELPADFCADGNPNGIAWDDREGVFYLTGQRCSEIWKMRFR